MIDVELADAWRASAVLAFVGIAQHEVAPREANAEAGSAIVALKVKDARDPQDATHDGQRIILRAHRQGAPCAEVVKVALFVESLRGPAEEEHQTPANGCDADRREMPIEEQNRAV